MENSKEKSVPKVRKKYTADDMERIFTERSRVVAEKTKLNRLSALRWPSWLAIGCLIGAGALSLSAGDIASTAEKTHQDSVSALASVQSELDKAREQLDKIPDDRNSQALLDQADAAADEITTVQNNYTSLSYEDVSLENLDVNKLDGWSNQEQKYMTESLAESGQTMRAGAQWFELGIGDENLSWHHGYPVLTENGDVSVWWQLTDENGSVYAWAQGVFVDGKFMSMTSANTALGDGLEEALLEKSDVHDEDDAKKVY